jgi:hypothetical protein
MADTPIFNIDLLSFDTFILAVRTTDGKILMKLDSDGVIATNGDFIVNPNMGYYDKEKNEINYSELPEKPKSNE